MFNKIQLAHRKIINFKNLNLGNFILITYGLVC
jgi:hypothetical protein